MTLMWKAAAAFILAIGAGGFVAGSVLGDPGGPPEVGDPIVLNDGSPDSQPRGSDPTSRPTDDDGTPDQGGSNDDDGPDTVYHTPDDLDDDDSGHGDGGDDDSSGPGSGDDSSGPGSGDDSSGPGSGDDHGDDD